MEKTVFSHCGHRARMAERVIKAPECLADHELLEVLLYSVERRKNTNGVAHALLNCFGTIENVFDASPELLMSVTGIGKSACMQIKLVSQIVARLQQPKKKPRTHLSYGQCKEEFVRFFKNCDEEKLLVYFLNARKECIADMVFTSQKIDMVSAEINEIVRAFAVHKPVSVILAHNHPSGSPVPSDADHATTATMFNVCALNNVEFLDHVIVAGEECYSYFMSGMLDYIKSTLNLRAVISKKFGVKGE